MGFFLTFFPIQRGCKQEGPLSPYMFIRCAEILLLIVKSNNNIKEVDVVKLNLTQFADDTLIFLDGSEN